MTVYDTVREDVTAVASFLEQVEQFTFLYQELTAVSDIVETPDEEEQYQDALCEEMKTVGRGLKEDYTEASNAYQRLDRFTHRVQESIESQQLDWFYEKGLGEPAQFYGEVKKLLSRFESIDSDSFGEQPAV